MKRFISWVSAIAVFVSVINCREAEELTTIPDEIQNHSISAKVKKDSSGVTAPTSNGSNSLELLESDPPPKKDGIKW